MEDKENSKQKYKDSHGSEIMGTIIFTLIIALLMWAASIFIH